KRPGLSPTASAKCVHVPGDPPATSSTAALRPWLQWLFLPVSARDRFAPLFHAEVMNRDAGNLEFAALDHVEPLPGKEAPGRLAGLGEQKNDSIFPGRG